MQSHDGKHQCSEAHDTDGRRDTQRSTVETALGMALAKVADALNRQVRVAEPNKPCDLSVSMKGKGGVAA